VLVTFYGTRGSCPCAGDGYDLFGGNTSCVLLDIGDDNPLIIDAGTGLRELGVALRPRLRAEGRAIQARMLLTHLHYDHLLGLPFFCPLEDEGAVLEVYGPKQDDATLSEVINTAVTPPFFPVKMKEFRGEVRLIEVGEEDFALGDAKIVARRIPHTGPTLGFRVEAAGATLTYISDHQAPLDMKTVEPKVLELCRDADVLIHDAQYDEEEFAAKPDWGHSTIAYAVHVAATAGVKTLVLFHHDPSHDDDRLAELELEALEAPGATSIERIISAREGMTLDLGSSTR